MSSSRLFDLLPAIKALALFRQCQFGRLGWLGKLWRFGGRRFFLRENLGLRLWLLHANADAEQCGKFTFGGNLRHGLFPIDALLAKGFVDTYRHVHPTDIKYSWWSFRAGARSKNIGWRIDYVLVSKGFEKSVKEAFILNEVMGSDHCPVGIAW